VSCPLVAGGVAQQVRMGRELDASLAAILAGLAEFSGVWAYNPLTASAL
jgi:hypothetical protein